MKQENKELLLKDLCARLIYNVIVEYRGAKVNLTQYARSIKLEDCKPYLRPMSSMTEEEKKELKKLCEEDLSEFAGFIINGHGLSHDGLYMFDKLRQLEFCLSHHLDFRGFIDKDLALEAPSDMYKLKEE